jgi:hypothetical protein
LSRSFCRRTGGLGSKRCWQELINPVFVSSPVLGFVLGMDSGSHPKTVAHGPQLSRVLGPFTVAELLSVHQRRCKGAFHLHIAHTALASGRDHSAFFMPGAHTNTQTRPGHCKGRLRFGTVCCCRSRASARKCPLMRTVPHAARILLPNIVSQGLKVSL